MNDRAIPIAVVAAMKRELKPLLHRAYPNVALVHTGEGAKNVQSRFAPWLRERRVHAVVSIGIAGALSPSLSVGDLVIARKVQGTTQTKPSPELLSMAEGVRARGLVIHFGTVMTTDRVICEAQGKRSMAIALGTNDIGCVDMESAAIAQICAERGLPFLIVRCISDGRDEDLPLDFNRCRDAGGGLQSGKIFMTALLQPQSIRGLWELRRRTRLCAERLAKFVEQLIPLCNLAGRRDRQTAVEQ